MDLNAIVAAFGSHNWLLLVMIAALYARTIFSDKSKFRFTLSPNWLPVFSGAAGAVVVADTALMGGKSWGVAVLMGVAGFVAGGCLDGMMTAFFGDPAKAPTLLRFLVMLVDDVFKGGMTVKQTTETAVTVPAPAAPPANNVKPQ